MLFQAPPPHLSSITSLLSVMRPQAYTANTAKRQGRMAAIGGPPVALPSASVQMQAVGLGGNVQRREQPAKTHRTSTFQNSSQQQNCGISSVGVTTPRSLPASNKFLAHMTHMDGSIAKPRLHLVPGWHLVS